MVSEGRTTDAHFPAHPSLRDRAGRRTTLVDVVATGDTLGALLTYLKRWSDGELADWRAVAGKIPIVGLTLREKSSPKTWRWQQHADWVEQLRP